MRKFFILLCILASGCVIMRPQKLDERRYQNITPQQLMELIEHNEKFVLVDVRSPEEYADGHINKAINIPHAEIKLKSRQLGCKCGKVVVYSRNGHAGEIVAQTLLELGFKKAVNLYGGIETWEKAGGKLIK
ncbi:MAG: rhodanese-like domain-containing protein [bacterium]|nr:rhodanese-like domain-containing protein [bacterium]